MRFHAVACSRNPFCFLPCMCLSSASWEHPALEVGGEMKKKATFLYWVRLPLSTSPNFMSFPFWAFLLECQLEFNTGISSSFIRMNDNFLLPSPSVLSHKWTHSTSILESKYWAQTLSFFWRVSKWQLYFYTVRYYSGFHSSCQVSVRGKSPEFR